MGHELDPKISRAATISYSLVLASLSCLLLIFVPFLRLLLAVGWAGVVGYCSVKCGRRSWPVMLGAPLVIYGLRLFYAIYFEGGP